MASVWLGRDSVLDRPVAVKVLADAIGSDPEFLARFRREARVAAGLSHPNLIDVYDLAEVDERPYLVMEYVPGEPLADLIANRRPLDCERLAAELLGALDHIHTAGIVHRDVKTGNVLITPDDQAKLIDFGIALPRGATSLTRTGHLIGTARYLAPEVLAGEPATERNDLFSCGVLLRECAGSGELSAITAQLGEEDPDLRPVSAAAALAELERGATLFTGPPTQAHPPGWKRGGPTETMRLGGVPRVWRIRAAATLAIVAAVIGAAIVLVLVSSRSEGGRDVAANARRQGGLGEEQRTAPNPSNGRVGSAGSGSSTRRLSRTISATTAA